MLGIASGGGTGSSLGKATLIVCGVAALVSTLITFVSVWLQSKNYRKPLLQRYVIRILLMVPIYSAASFASLLSQDAAFYLDPLRDIYEAFTIYTFFQLLSNFIGGERSLIVMMHGRPPVSHPWPFKMCFAKVDISDPHTFLAVKRGILQYAWLKPILAIATIIMKSTGTYQEGYISLQSGYLWSGLLYNISITLSLYALAMFWVCMSDDLKPFRPVPKFLCIKLIVFAVWWQGFFLSLLQFGGAFPDVKGYTPDNLSAAIQDALICLEMPLFAVFHWYAFSWHDYADVTISAARMPVKYALRDAFGPVDLIQDTKETFWGAHYEYRVFDSGDNVIAHEESHSRQKRMSEGMRYERGGKGKYWLPNPKDVDDRTPLLGGSSGPSRAATLNFTNKRREEDQEDDSEVGEPELDPGEEKLYASAKDLEFGDWNYPVITAHIPSSERWIQSDPNVITTATNRNLLQPTKANKERRQSNIKNDIESFQNQSGSSVSGGSKARSRAPVVNSLLREESSSSHSAKSGRSQLVDLMVEDTQAEEVERVRARKEGGAAWNQDEGRQFIRTYDDEDQGTVVRDGFEPGQLNSGSSENIAHADDEQNESEDRAKGPAEFGNLDDRHIWGSGQGE